MAEWSDHIRIVSYETHVILQGMLQKDETAALYLPWAVMPWLHKALGETLADARARGVIPPCADAPRSAAELEPPAAPGEG